MKSTTKAQGTQGGPTVRDLMDRLGLTPAKIEAEHRVSVSTVYRALNGARPQPLYLAALAGALGVSEPDLLSAIKQSAMAKGRAA